MATDTQERKHSAPYISWKTFIAFLANIQGKVPTQVDPSVLRNMSGTARSQLISALRFLDLIELDGTRKDSLQELADSYNSERWKPVLKGLIDRAYGRIINGINISSATPAMLRDRFRNNGGVDGGTIDSAMRFYLSALKEADIPFSQHLTIRQRAPRGNGTRKRASGKVSEPGSAGEDSREFEIPEDTFAVPFEVLGLNGLAYLPDDVSEEQWDAISQYVRMVIGFRLKARPKQAAKA